MAAPAHHLTARDVGDVTRVECGRCGTTLHYPRGTAPPVSELAPRHRCSSGLVWPSDRVRRPAPGKMQFLSALSGWARMEPLGAGRSRPPLTTGGGVHAGPRPKTPAR